jgi:hypothetical protein
MKDTLVVVTLLGQSIGRTDTTYTLYRSITEASAPYRMSYFSFGAAHFDPSTPQSRRSERQSEPQTTPSRHTIRDMLIQETHKDVPTQAGGDMSN